MHHVAALEGLAPADNNVPPDEPARDLLDMPGEVLSDAQRQWLSDWCERWQATVVYERRAFR